MAREMQTRFEVDDSEIAERRSRSSRKSVVETLATQGDPEEPLLVDAVSNTHPSARSTPRTSILSEAADKLLKEEDPELHETFTTSYIGYIFQGALLLAAVFSYVGPPIVTNWAKTVAYEKNPKTGSYDIPVKNANAYYAEAVVISSKLVVSFACVAISYYFDKRDGTRYISEIFNFRNLLPWLPIGFFYAVSDIAENMAGGRVDAALMSVLSQTRLSGTAFFGKLVSGKSYTTLQWSLLFTLSLVIFGWQQFDSLRKAASSGRKTEALGLICALSKNFISILCGVFSEKILKGVKQPVFVQQAQNCLMGVLTVVVFVIPLNLMFFYPYLDTLQEAPLVTTGYGSCSSSPFHTKAWDAASDIAQLGGLPLDGFVNESYRSWVDEAWMQCKQKDDTVEAVSISAAEFKCYKACEGIDEEKTFETWKVGCGRSNICKQQLSWKDDDGAFYNLLKGRPYPKCKLPTNEAAPECKCCCSPYPSCLSPLAPDTQNLDKIDAHANSFWGLTTFAVILMYVMREFFLTYCVKTFDALIKNLCNAAATIFAYLIAVNFMGKEFVTAQFAFTLVIGFDILNYALASSK